MPKQIIFTIIFLLGTHLSFAQNKIDTIQIRTTWLGNYQYWYEGKNVKFRELKTVMTHDLAAAHVLRKARHTAIITTSFFIPSLACAIAVDISPRHFSPGLGIASLGLLAISVPFAISTKHYLKKSVKMYNYDLQKTSCDHRRTEFYFSFSGTAAGVGIRF